MSWLDRILGRRVITGDMTGGDIVGRHNMASISINGRSFSGNSLSITGDRIIVDGRDITSLTEVDVKSVLEVKITGDVHDITCEKGLNIVGNVHGNIDARGGVNANDVVGDIKAGGGVSADDVKGDIYANGSVSCDDVTGSVQAGGSVSRG